ncbi:hypothetical protein HNY73_003412 [Argiope bruennichi]|uniref:Uncharacterized protein n=1 Tax=Argiope bruennichi TaxID=94029 RepID=A0A8T0FQH2_ARGBR|nr:hypothetical protein HNY73_003412 [Argiope bruennichi]
MVRWVAVFLLAAAVSADFAQVLRDKRQVTYHADEHHHDIDEDDDSEPVRPVTKKPLPTQLVYPGDLSGFYTTDSPLNAESDVQNVSSSDSHSNLQIHQRQKRNTNGRRRIGDFKKNIRNPLRAGKFTQNKDNVPMGSELYSSYHKPSVSIMNDVPVEMSFDGAGFLRYDDEDFDTEKKTKTDSDRRRTNGGRSPKSRQSGSQALDDFRKVFNVSRERTPSPVKYDDDGASYQSETPVTLTNQEKPIEYGTQGAENGTPLSVDFMTNYQNAFQNPYQNGMFNTPQFNYAPTQVNSNPQVPSYDPFSFTYPNAFSGQSNMNQMVMPQVMQQDSFMQNHRIPQNANTGAATQQAIYPQIPQQAFPSTSMYSPAAAAAAAAAANPQQNHKTQRRRRSVDNSKPAVADIATSASEVAHDRYRYSRVGDQQDSSSGFIPITGTYNGGTIQLIPYYGQTPISPASYPHSPPTHSVPSYSVPVSAEGRFYPGPGYYHPSEARRYSYGILGSGNFEVIRGGIFPGERQQNYQGGYQEHRAPYANENFDNYGTTEIIIDGPIQGFQGFDNFPIHLINALSKHSEVAVRPELRNKEATSAEV